MADTPDFSKIWGSNGNVTYKFTDDNYLTGWSFVGDTPPARGMFDKFFMGTDTKLKYLYDRLNAGIDKTYTVDDTKAPTSNTEQLLATLSELAHMIKTAGGTSDWKTTPATNLATVATLVSNLASGSDVTWSGKKFTNSKLGITGLMDTNGYVSFGPNFGGLIIQWGTITCPSVSANVVSRGSASLPISLSTAVLASLSEIVDGGTEQNWEVFHWSSGDLTTIKTIAIASVSMTNPKIRWLVIGK